MADMADDGDEDVVFQHSALYDHLQNVGYQVDDINPENRRPRTSAESPRHNQSMSKAFFRHLHASWLTWLGVGDEWKQQRKMIDTRWGGEVCQAALAEDALEPEDAEFLQHVSHVQQQEEAHDGGETVSRTSRYGLERLLSVGVGVTAYTTARLFYPRITVMTLTYDWIVGLFGLLLILPPSICLLRTWAYHRQHARVLRAFSAMLVTAAKWRKMTRRSIRLVQEMELVARGFTLVSRVSPAERLEVGHLLEARRQCPDLRRLILLTSRDLMIQMRNATNDLIQAWPLGAELETMYLCQVSLEEYGSIITATDEQILASSTDNYGLTHIKAVLEICDLQLSEYVKRMVLMCLVPVPAVVSAQHGADVFEASLPTATRQLSYAADTLMTSYNVHRCGLLTERLGDGGGGLKAEVADQAPAKQLSNTYTAVHSLDLHLQTALMRARTMGDELEALCANSTMLETDLKKRLNDDLGKVKADLDACIECWDEAFLHIGASGRQARSSVVSLPASVKVAAQEATRQDPIPLFDMEDLVVPDQVFEAYTDDNDLDTSDWGTDELLTAEEIEKKKGEKKEALRLLKELKTVIAVRAADWDQREERARQRQQLTDDGKSPMDSQQDLGTSLQMAKDEAGDEVREGVKEGFREAGRVGGDSPSTVHVGFQHRSSRSSDDSGDADQLDLAHQDCVHTCGEYLGENNVEELVDDLHEDLVNLAPQPLQTAVFESVSDDEDIFGGSEDFSADEDDDSDQLNHCNTDGTVDWEDGSEARLSVLKERLSQGRGAELGFSASAVATLAVQRSQAFGQGSSQTFGDGDSDSEEGVIQS